MRALGAPKEQSIWLESAWHDIRHHADCRIMPIGRAQRLFAEAIDSFHASWSA